MSGFSRILADKLLRLRDADTQQVLELEKTSDDRGYHPTIAPDKKKED